MTIDYISVDEFKDRVAGSGAQAPGKEYRIAEHITAASRKVDAICHRSFGPDAGAASARTFHALDPWFTLVNDCYDITAVAVDEADDALFSTAWAAADYETDPANGIGRNGTTGWPVTGLRAVRELTFPVTVRRRAVRVTAKWGWQAVPADVKEATYLLTNRLSCEVAVPGGVVPPNIDFGMPGSPLQRPYTAEGLLEPFVYPGSRVGVA